MLLYAALFLHETEEGKVQNRLEKLWVEIDDLSKAALSKQTAFLQRVAAMTDSTLNKLFGARLFSAGAVSTSVCFSIGSVLFFVLYGQVESKPLSSEVIVALLIVGIISFLAGLSPIPFRYLGLLWIPCSIVFVAIEDWNMLKGPNWRALMDDFLPVLMILVGGFVSDVLFIAGSRWCLRKGSESQNGGKVLAFLTLNGCLGFMLVSPVLWGYIAYKHGTPFGDAAHVGVLLIGASNLVAGAISLLFILLALAALVHLGVWPILERPIYSLQRYGLVRRPKLLAAASVTCLMFAWPHSPIIQGIARLIHGG